MKEYFKGLKAEWSKIIWPSRSNLKNKTVQVVVCSLVLGCIIAMLDYIFQTGVNGIIGLF